MKIMKLSYGVGIVLIVGVMTAQNVFGTTAAQRARDASNATARGRSAGGIGSGGRQIPKICEKIRGGYMPPECWTDRQYEENFRNNEQQKKDDLARLKQKAAEDAAQRAANARWEEMMRGRSRAPELTAEERARQQALAAANAEWLKNNPAGTNSIILISECRKMSRGACEGVVGRAFKCSWRQNQCFN